MRKCGPLSEGVSTRISLALTLRLSVLMAPEKPLPVEVKVPMVAIVSYPWFSRAAPIATSMAVVRPEAIDLHPKGRNEMEGGRQRLSWTARNGAQRQGKKVEDGRCRDKIESPRSGIGLRSDQPLSRTLMGAPVAKTHGMKTGGPSRFGHSHQGNGRRNET